MSIGAVVARLAAVVVAILLVVGALAWRDSRQSTATPDDQPTTTTSDAPTVDVTEIVCAAELRICDHLAVEGVTVRMEDGVATADALVEAGDAPLWITVRALVDVVEDARDRGGAQPLLQTTDAIAVSPLVLAVWDDRAAVLTAACDPAGWDCIGSLAEAPWEAAGGDAAWGSLKPGHAPPNRSGVGLLVLAQAAADRLDSGEFSARDLDTPEFQRWFGILEDAVPTFSGAGGSFLTRMVQFGPASVDIVGTTEAEAAEILNLAGARGDAVTVLPSSPPVLVEVVIATPRGTSPPPALVDAVRDALVGVGWRSDPATPPTLLPDSQATVDGAVTFDGGLLEALRLRWERVR